VFDDPEPTQLSRDWIEELANSASSTGGILLVAEHFDTGPVELPGAAAGLGEGADLSLGTVDVEHIDVDRLTVAGTEVSAEDVKE
jgi:hypothetical protein